MATREQRQGLVLRSVDFGEADRIVHLLTPERGRVGALARSARKSVRRFPGTLDVFNLLDIEWSPPRRGGLGRLDRATLVDAHLALRRTPGRYALASYLVELLDRLAPEGGNPSDCRRLFGFATAALSALSDTSVRPIHRVLFELRALEALGLRPALVACVRCGRPHEGAAPLRFLVADGGAVCARCGASAEGGLPVHLGTLRMLEQGLRFELAALDRFSPTPVALAEARQLVARFHRFHVGVELRSERFLDEIFGAAGRFAA